MCKKLPDNGLYKQVMTSTKSLIFLSSVANVVWKNVLAMASIIEENIKAKLEQHVFRLFRIPSS